MATSYKGKYPGPDIFKGNKTLLAAYNKKKKGLSAAARRKLAQTLYSSSSKKTPAKPTYKNASALKPPAKKPAQPKPPSAYPKTNTTSNGSGNIDLQTNYELMTQELDARERYAQEVEAAQASQEQAAITEAEQRKQFGQQKLSDFGKLNANLAYRGAHTGIWGAKQADLLKQQSEQETAITSEKSRADTEADTRKKSAQGTLDRALANIKLGQQEYTNEQSRKNPTPGSSPINAGVKHTTANPPSKKPAAKTLTAAQIAAAKRALAARRK